MTDMSKAEFTVFYDGEALRGSRMEVRELAPALLAFCELLERSNEVLNGDDLTVTVNIKAFEAGCFGISFEVVQSIANQVMSFFAPGTGPREALEILALLGIAPASMGYGLFWLLEKARGRNATGIRKGPDDTAEISFDEGGQIETIKVKGDVAALFANNAVRIAVDRVMEPIRGDGIDSLSVGTDGKHLTLVGKETVEHFSRPDFAPVLLNKGEPPQERYFSIVSLSFKEDNKWRLTDGSTPISVKMTDKRFLRDVDENRINFAKGDTLKVLLRTIQTQTVDGLRTEYEAEKILDHIKRDRQGYLPVT